MEKIKILKKGIIREDVIPKTKTILNLTGTQETRTLKNAKS